MIKPYIGQQVSFHGMPFGHAPQFSVTPVCFDSSKCMTATVVYVWTDVLVNLTVTDHQGNAYPLTCVPYHPEPKRFGEFRVTHATPVVAPA